MAPEQDKLIYTSDNVRTHFVKIEPKTNMVENIINVLNSRVFGQNDASIAVARRVAIAESPFTDPSRPLASVFMMGPTGTGKTEMARALAEHLFKDLWQDRLLTIDCTQFTAKEDVSRFIGSSPQYVGYGDSGIITKKFLAQSPNIIVFDEVEKAHQAVWKLLLRVLDKGKMMARVGNNDDDHAKEEELLFNKSYIFLTSNVGASQVGEIQRRLAGQSLSGENANERIKNAANDALKELFSPMPEFLGRLDDIVVFQPLGQEQYELIFNKTIAEINQQLSDKIGAPQLSFTLEFRSYVLSLINKEYGAREIRRYIEREFIQPAVNITSTTNLQNTMLIADYQDEKVSFYSEHFKSKSQQEVINLPIITSEPKPTTEAEIIDFERKTWKEVLGADVDIKPLPAILTPEIIDKLRVYGFELRYIPEIKLDMVNRFNEVDISVNKVDVNNFPEDEIEDSFQWLENLATRHGVEDPEYKYVPSLHDKAYHCLTSLQARYVNWKLNEFMIDEGRVLGSRFWDQVLLKRIDVPKLPGQWIAVETIIDPDSCNDMSYILRSFIFKKIKYEDRSKISWADINREIQNNKQNILTLFGLPENIGVRMLEVVEWCLLANREKDWGSEWTSTKINLQETMSGKPIQPNDSCHLYMGDISNSADGVLRWEKDDYTGDDKNKIGFRIAIVFDP